MAGSSRSPYTVGRSEIITARSSATASGTVATLATPTSGTRARIVYLSAMFDSGTAASFEVYFGTGTNITTNAGKEIANFFMDLTDNPSDGIVFPQDSGPIGAADDVISIRSSGSAGTFSIIVGYTEMT